MQTIGTASNSNNNFAFVILVACQGEGEIYHSMHADFLRDDV